jgi:Histidine kinase-, DNA gyrase B-, and HSP90-like ATPase
MKINLINAVKHFHPQPSFEQIYFEAIANAIDAGATKIGVSIAMDAFDQAGTLRLSVTDNGCGFDDSHFTKFCRLLEVTTGDRKGLGRLVFLQYFKEVRIDSTFKGKKRRTFRFNEDFDESSVKVTASDTEDTGSTLAFSSFSGSSLHSYGDVVPERLAASIQKHFFPTFLKVHQGHRALEITITLTVKAPNPEQGFVTGSHTLSAKDVPQLEVTRFSDHHLDFYQQIEVHHAITQDLTKAKSIEAAICIDGRSIPIELMPQTAVPGGYQMTFYFVSDFFKGKTNSSRQAIQLPTTVSDRDLKTTLRREVGAIIAKAIPAVTEHNRKTKADLDRQYPHLAGYYPSLETGLIIRDDALEAAQMSFLLDQRKILDCEVLNDAQYAKAQELSSRTLMAYVLYRQRIIERLAQMDKANPESEIHSLMVPIKRTLENMDQIEDLNINNVWLLDDKYMSYNKVLSEQEMSEVVTAITGEETDVTGRADITIVFSNDPSTAAKVDVVVVELKKLGLGLAKREEVVSQLQQRARRLLEFYGSCIERIWFYGIVDFNPEFRKSLIEREFKPLFSHGQVMYRRQPIIVGDNEDTPFLADFYIMDYNALVKDAGSRNATFMKILKHRISTFMKDEGITQPVQPVMGDEMSSEQIDSPKLPTGIPQQEEAITPAATAKKATKKRAKKALTIQDDLAL